MPRIKTNLKPRTNNLHRAPTGGATRPNKYNRPKNLFSRIPVWTLLGYRGRELYDAASCSLWVQDPKAEKYYALTPYNYVPGVPVGLVDPDGMSAEDSDEKSDFQQWFEAWKEEKDARSMSYQQRRARAELEMIQAIATAEAASNEAGPDDPL